MRCLVAVLLLSLCVFAEELPKEFSAHFTYDRNAPLDIKENSTENRETVRVVDLSYASPAGGRVSAYLVLPAGPGPFPAIVYAHWRNTQHSPKTSNGSSSWTKRWFMRRPGRSAY